jgi:hypothetical protein
MAANIVKGIDANNAPNLPTLMIGSEFSKTY